MVSLGLKRKGLRYSPLFSCSHLFHLVLFVFIYNVDDFAMCISRRNLVHLQEKKDTTGRKSRNVACNQVCAKVLPFSPSALLRANPQQFVKLLILMTYDPRWPGEGWREKRWCLIFHTFCTSQLTFFFTYINRINKERLARMTHL